MKTRKQPGQRRRCDKKSRIGVVAWLVFAVMLVGTARLSADEPMELPCSSIDTVYILNSGGIGDTCQVVYKFTPTCNSYFRTIFGVGSDKLRKLDNPQDALTQCVGGVTYQRTYNCIILDTNETVANFTVEMCRIMDLGTHNTNTVSCIFKTGLEPVVALESTSLDNRLQTLAESAYDTSGQHFIINGRAGYQYGDSLKSGYNVVRLYFMNEDVVYNNDSIPLRYLFLANPLSNGKYVKGVHYAECDDYGNFSFDFYSSTIGKNNKIVIYVEKKNFCVDVTSPANHEQINRIDGNGIFRVFPIPYYHYVGSDPLVVIDDAYVGINLLDGTLFRYASLSKMFIKKRLDVGSYDSLPFNIGVTGDRLPCIKSYRIRDSEPGSAAWYTGSVPKITFHNQYLSEQQNPVVIHEYGHYVDHAMANMVTTGTTQNAEAFAIFYVDPVRAWINARFAEPVPVHKCVEVSPYYSLSKYNQTNGEFIAKERGHNISPQGWLTQKENPNIPAEGAFAAFLTNLYDSKNEGEFTADRLFYEWNVDKGCFEDFATRGYNNDDLEYGRTVFDWWIDNPNMNFAEFYNLVLTSTDNVIKQNSITRLYNFLNTTTIDPYNLAPCPANYNGFSHDSTTLYLVSGSYPKEINAHIAYGNNGTVDYFASWEVNNREKGYIVWNTALDTVPVFACDGDTTVYTVRKTIDPGNYELSPYSDVNDPFGSRSWDIQIVTLPRIFAKESGVKDITKQSVLIYPNPANASIRISTSDGISCGYDIFDITGQKVMSIPFGTTDVNVSSLPAGYYFIKTNNGVANFIKY